MSYATPSEILALHHIPSGGRRSAYTTICPQCSHARRKQRDQCLSVLIDGRGVRWNCHHCGFKGGEFYDERRIGEVRPFISIISGISDNINNDAARIKRAREIWVESADPNGTIAEKYLIGRGLNLDGIADRVIRFHAACPWKDDETDALLRVPAMIAAMRDIQTDDLRAIQITSLRADGSKVGRKTRGVAAGTCIKLSHDESVTQGLTIGEGLETVLAGMKLGFCPAWACGGTANLRNFPVLGGIEALTILVDHDEPGQSAAAECAGRWLAAGIEVFRHMPRKSGDDFNHVVIRSVA
jgi:hypothetical protein